MFILQWVQNAPIVLQRNELLLAFKGKGLMSFVKSAIIICVLAAACEQIQCTLHPQFGSQIFLGLYKTNIDTAAAMYAG